MLHILRVRRLRTKRKQAATGHNFGHSGTGCGLSALFGQESASLPRILRMSYESAFSALRRSMTGGFLLSAVDVRSASCPAPAPLAHGDAFPAIPRAKKLTEKSASWPEKCAFGNASEQNFTANGGGGTLWSSAFINPSHFFFPACESTILLVIIV